MLRRNKVLPAMDMHVTIRLVSIDSHAKLDKALAGELKIIRRELHELLDAGPQEVEDASE